MDSMTKEHTIHFDKEAWHKRLVSMEGLKKVDHLQMGNSLVEFLEPVYIREQGNLIEFIGTDTKQYQISFLSDYVENGPEINKQFILQELQSNIKSIKEILK